MKRIQHGWPRAALFVAACVLAMLVSVSAASAAPAGTENCDYDSAPLIDSLGHEWDMDEHGVFQDGDDDEFDEYVDLVVGGERYLNNDGLAACGVEDGGREVVYPTTTFGNGLEVSRKIYVPATGTAFARILSVLHNPTSAPITADVSLECDDDYDSSTCPEDGGSDNSSPLGSDDGTTVVATSSGDSIANTDDYWAVSDDSDPAGDDNALIHEWDGEGGVDRIDSLYLRDGKSAFQAKWNGVTVAPGETAVYMFVVAQSTDRADAPAAAAGIAEAGPQSDVYAGLSDTEVRALRNWEALDRDGDGVENEKDNCPTVANADQSDIDGDGKGDACDSDIDGDGLGNGSEDEFGTNARSADTDNDGVADKADQCPTKAGKGEDGCPLAETATVPGDTTPPNTQIVSVDGAKNLGDLLNGFTVTLTCDEACEARVRALGRMPTGSAVFSVTGGFNRVLGRTYSPFKTGTQKVRVRPCERKPGGPQSKACLKRLKKAGSAKRSFLVKVYVIAQDKAGNSRETSKLIRVKRA